MFRGGFVRVRFGRSPHGERGLKLFRFDGVVPIFRSLPSRGAWIEISERDGPQITAQVAPLTGSVD